MSSKAASGSGLTQKSSGMSLAMVRIQNFRCLRTVEVRLKKLSMLIGENNAGKTSFLDALHASIGSGSKSLNEEDIWTEDKEKSPPKTRTIIIDVLIHPTDATGKRTDVFPAGSPWLELWGSGVIQDDEERDMVAIRTQLKWSVIKGEYIIERKFLKDWPKEIKNLEQAKQVEKVGQLTAMQLNPIAMYLLDAKRDGADEIRTRGSVWHRMIADPGLSEEDVEEIEKKLNVINELFVTNSGILTHVKGHLARVSDVVNCEKENVLVTPVARRLRDLNKGMDVVLATSGASAFSLSKQGMGTRSLASVLMFRAYMS